MTAPTAPAAPLTAARLRELEALLVPFGDLGEWYIDENDGSVCANLREGYGMLELFGNLGYDSTTNLIVGAVNALPTLLAAAARGLALEAENGAAAHAAGARAALAWVNDRLALYDFGGLCGVLRADVVKIVQGIAEDGDTLPAEMVATC